MSGVEPDDEDYTELGAANRELRRIKRNNETQEQELAKLRQIVAALQAQMEGQPPVPAPDETPATEPTEIGPPPTTAPQGPVEGESPQAQFEGATPLPFTIEMLAGLMRQMGG